MDVSDMTGGRLRQQIAAYLRSFGLSDLARIEVLIPGLMARVAEGASGPDAVTAAMDRCIIEWLRTILDLDRAEPEQVLIQGRAAFLLSAAAARWPDAFLAEVRPPVAMVSALRAAMPVATPPERPLEMIAQPLPSPSVARFVPRLRRLAPVGTSEPEG